MFRKTLKTAVGAFNKVCNLLLGIVMVAMFLVLLLQIISRFIAFIPLPWSQDLIVFLLTHLTPSVLKLATFPSIIPSMT